MFLWCLSPLGSQASLLVFCQGQLSDSTAITIRYRSTGPAASIWASEPYNIDRDFFESLLGMSATAMARHEDIFGDVKIPRFELLNSSLSSDGWKSVPPVLEHEHFSSLLGLRVVSLPRDRETRFSLESSYASAECGAFVKLPYSLNITLTDVHRLTEQSKFNLTETVRAGLMPGQRIPGHPAKHRRFLLDSDGTVYLTWLKAFLGMALPLTTLTDKTTAALRQLVLGSLYSEEADRRHFINIATCSVSEMRVDSAVFRPSKADSNECRVERMRLSRTDIRQPHLTHFENPDFAWNMTSRFLDDSSGEVGWPSSLELFL
jgi:hypothetical protein